MPQHPTYPQFGAPLKTVVGALAAGVNFQYSFPSQTWNLVNCLLIELTTDATVANRRMIVTLGDSSRPYAALPAVAVQTASLTVQYYFMLGVSFPNTAILDGIWTGPLPTHAIWGGGGRINSAIVNLQAGDQITDSYLYLEQFRDPVVV